MAVSANRSPLVRMMKMAGRSLPKVLGFNHIPRLQNQSLFVGGGGGGGGDVGVLTLRFLSSSCSGVAKKVEEETELALKPSTQSSYCSSRGPWLMLPPEVDPNGHDMVEQYFNLADKKVKRTKKESVRRELRGLQCVGSSHGWLAFISPRDGGLYLSDPLSTSSPIIQLPRIESLPTVLLSLRHKSNDNDNNSGVITEFMVKDRIGYIPSEEVSKDFITKLVFSSPPNLDRENCIVMAVQGHQEEKLAFCRLGDTTWTALNGPQRSYSELVYHSEHQ